MKIGSEKNYMVDVDDTLCMWNLSQYPDLPREEIDCYGHISVVCFNQKNINLAKKLQKLGYHLIVWSQSGADWAEAVANKAGLTGVDFMTKPRGYLDDLPADVWMGDRLWRHPITGESNDKYNRSSSNNFSPKEEG